MPDDARVGEELLPAQHLHSGGGSLILVEETEPAGNGEARPLAVLNHAGALTDAAAHFLRHEQELVKREAGIAPPFHTASTHRPRQNGDRQGAPRHGAVRQADDRMLPRPRDHPTIPVPPQQNQEVLIQGAEDLPEPLITR
jgi:hypothetical protein